MSFDVTAINNDPEKPSCSSRAKKSDKDIVLIFLERTSSSSDENNTPERLVNFLHWNLDCSSSDDSQHSNTEQNLQDVPRQGEGRDASSQSSTVFHVL